MRFIVGEAVIHSRYGLGQVTQLVIKQFAEGEKRLYYEISFPGSTLWIPLDYLKSGLRKLTVKSGISECRRLLKAPATPLNHDPRIRNKELIEHVNEGTLFAQCEVVRDLTAHGWYKSLSGKNADFLRSAKDVLYQEWAAVEEITISEAANEINSLLEENRQSDNNSS